MKRTLTLIVAFGMSAALWGCNSDETPAAGQAQPQSAPAWKVTLQSQCAGDASQCVAAHGFSVSADGSYLAGPAEGGQVLQGKLTDDEFKDISDKVAALSAPAAPAADNTDPQAEVCQAAVAGGSDDTLIVSHFGKDQTVAAPKDAQLCFQGVNSQAASDLLAAVKDLAAKYYTLPFPDNCAPQLAAVTSLFASVQSCATDADCVYVDDAFAAIPASTNQYVVTDSCTAAKPLAVANASALAAHQADLSAAWAAAQAACGAGTANDRFNTCIGQNGFMSGQAVPHCQAGVCTIPAASHF